MHGMPPKGFHYNFGGHTLPFVSPKLPSAVRSVPFRISRMSAIVPSVSKYALCMDIPDTEAGKKLEQSTSQILSRLLILAIAARRLRKLPSAWQRLNSSNRRGARTYNALKPWRQA